LLNFDAVPSLEVLASRCGDRIVHVGGQVKDRLGLSAVLVRPDGFVAWAAEGPPDAREAARAASRWFGELPRSRKRADASLP
jgi:hypothetical protein